MHWQLVNLQVCPRKWAKLGDWRQKSSRRRCTQCASAALSQRERSLMATGLQTAVSRQGQANSSIAIKQAVTALCPLPHATQLHSAAPHSSSPPTATPWPPTPPHTHPVQRRWVADVQEVLG